MPARRPRPPPKRPVPMLCTYRVKKGREPEFLALLASHWPALRKAGLAAPAPPAVHRSVDRRGRTVFVETFAWAHAGAADDAHALPEVLAVWGPMEKLTTEMEFLDLEPVRLPPARGSRRAR